MEPLTKTNQELVPYDSLNADEKAKVEATAECVMCLDCVRNCPETGALAACLDGRAVSVSKSKSRD